MNINQLWCTQRNLKRIDLIPKLLQLYEFSTPIILHKCEDGEIQINDGHHRLVSIWLQGRLKLFDSEFILCDVEETRNRTKLRIKDLAEQYFQQEN